MGVSIIPYPICGEIKKYHMQHMPRTLLPHYCETFTIELASSVFVKNHENMFVPYTNRPKASCIIGYYVDRRMTGNGRIVISTNNVLRIDDYARRKARFYHDAIFSGILYR